jgi:hypothetical protein
MSNQINHRRGHGRIQGNGPRYENGCPEKGCNSTHVARGRKKYKKRRNRISRRDAKAMTRNRMTEAELALIEYELGWIPGDLGPGIRKPEDR